MTELPCILADDPDINRCPARFLRFEVGPCRGYTCKVEDVNFEAFYVFEAVIISLSVLVRAAPLTRPLFYPFRGYEALLLRFSIQLVGLFAPMLLFREFIFTNVESNSISNNQQAFVITKNNLPMMQILESLLR